MIKCQNCGKDFTEEYMFCPHCGSKRKDSIIDSNNEKNINYIVMGWIFIILGVFGWLISALTCIVANFIILADAVDQGREYMYVFGDHRIAVFFILSSILLMTLFFIAFGLGIKFLLQRKLKKSIQKNVNSIISSISCSIGEVGLIFSSSIYLMMICNGGITWIFDWMNSSNEYTAFKGATIVTSTFVLSIYILLSIIFILVNFIIVLMNSKKLFAKQ